MKSCRFSRLAGLVSLVAAGATHAADNTGITDTEVRIGATMPLSGPTALTGVMGKGEEAYYSYVNDQGGVLMADGKRRKINFFLADDAFEAARSMANVQRQVTRDNVFAVAGVLSTPPNFAIRPYLNEEQVPHLLAYSQSSAFSLDTKKYPWTATGWMISFLAEATIYADYLKKTKPSAKVAILFINNDGGKEMVRAFEKAIQGSGVKVVAKQGYELSSPTVDSEVTALAQSGADVFFNVSSGKQAAQSIRKAGELGWKPMHFIIGQSSYVESILKPAGLNYATGLYTVTYMKDPGDSQWADDADLKTYRSIIAKYGHGLDDKDVSSLLGVAVAETFVKILEKSQPSRKSLMQAARNVQGIRVLGLRPGITMNTSATDPFLIESAYLQQFDGQRWKVLGDVVSFEGKTPQ